MQVRYAANPLITMDTIETIFCQTPELKSVWEVLLDLISKEAFPLFSVWHKSELALDFKPAFPLPAESRPASSHSPSSRSATGH